MDNGNDFECLSHDLYHSEVTGEPPKPHCEQLPQCWASQFWPKRSWGKTHCDDPDEVLDYNLRLLTNKYQHILTKNYVFLMNLMLHAHVHTCWGVCGLAGGWADGPAAAAGEAGATS